MISILHTCAQSTEQCFHLTGSNRVLQWAQASPVKVKVTHGRPLTKELHCTHGCQAGSLTLMIISFKGWEGAPRSTSSLP